MATEFEASLPDAEIIAACEQRLGYCFANKRWLVKGLTHASIAETRLESNERMEFLGDAVLGAVVCDRLFALFPEDAEGQMTQMKSEVVSRSACAQLATAIGLDQFVLMGKGLHQSREIPLSVLAGVFESVIAAIYLDGGYAAAFEFISSHLEDLIHHAAETAHIRNSKSQLQQWTQKERGKTPTYNLVDEAGPDHSKYFLVSAIVGEETYPPAWGANKKEAEQKAALNAYCILNRQPIPYQQSDRPFPEWFSSSEAAPQSESATESATEPAAQIESAASPIDDVVTEETDSNQNKSLRTSQPEAECATEPESPDQQQ